MTRCPNCGNELDIDPVEMSKKEFPCPDCAATLGNANRGKGRRRGQIFVAAMLVSALYDLAVLLILGFDLNPYSSSPLDVNLWITLGIPTLVTIPIVFGLFLVARPYLRPRLVVVRLSEGKPSIS